MNLCKDCRWWKPDGPYLDGFKTVWIQELGECLKQRFKPKNLDGYLDSVHRPGESNTSNPSDFSIPEWITFKTGPEFGCVHHEEKP